MITTELKTNPRHSRIIWSGRILNDTDAPITGNKNNLKKSQRPLSLLSATEISTFVHVLAAVAQDIMIEQHAIPVAELDLPCVVNEN